MLTNSIHMHECCFGCFGRYLENDFVSRKCIHVPNIYRMDERISVFVFVVVVVVVVEKYQALGIRHMAHATWESYLHI